VTDESKATKDSTFCQINISLYKNMPVARVNNILTMHSFLYCLVTKISDIVISVLLFFYYLLAIKNYQISQLRYIAYSFIRNCIVKGTLHSVEKTLIQKAYCVYYYILKQRRFFMSINSVVYFSLNFK